MMLADPATTVSFSVSSSKPRKIRPGPRPPRRCPDLQNKPVRKALHILATALGLLQILHPLTAKRFNERFLQHALAVPADPSLRGPTLQEILSADRAVWQAIHTLSRDHGWSVSDCMKEVGYCRQDIPSALQPRPRAAQVARIRSGGHPRSPACTRQQASPQAQVKCQGWPWWPHVVASSFWRIHPLVCSGLTLLSRTG